MKKQVIIGYLDIILICLLFFVGCGGGGATVTQSVNTPPPTINNTMLTGAVTNVLTGEVVPGANLSINGQAITAGNDGHYSYTPSSITGTIVVTGGAIERTVSYDLSVAGIKNISILPAGFNSANYWAYQWPGNPQRISLWDEKPKGFVICTKTWESGSKISDEVINNLKKIITEHVNTLHPKFADMTIEVFNGQPSDYPGVKNLSYDVSPLGVLEDGRILISFADNMINANGVSQCILNIQYQIIGGGITLLTREDILSTYLQYVFLHEVGHALCHFYHPFQNLASATDSVMNYDYKIKTYTEFDKQVITIMYKRCAGTFFPDNDPSGSGSFSSKGSSILGERNVEKFILPK